MSQKKLNVLESDKVIYLLVCEELVARIFSINEKLKNTEWSGLLVMKKIDSLEYDAVDMILADIGTPTFTEFDVAKLVNKIKPEYWEEPYILGMVHSHHNMKTFFSGEDMAQLKEGAETHDLFISLIVNNTFEWNVKASCKSKTKTTYSLPYSKNTTDTIESITIFSGEVEFYLNKKDREDYYKLFEVYNNKKNNKKEKKQDFNNISHTMILSEKQEDLFDKVNIKETDYDF